MSGTFCPACDLYADYIKIPANIMQKQWLDFFQKLTSLLFKKNCQDSKNDRLFASNIKVFYSILIFLQVKN